MHNRRLFMQEYTTMNDNANRHFLSILGFEGNELEDLIPKWSFAAQSVGLTEEDILYAADKWIPQYWDLSLRGVRMCIAAYVREFIEVFQLKKYRSDGCKILYGIMPSLPVCYRANKIAGGNKLHISYPDFMISTVLNAFFHKGSLFSDDDEKILNSKCGHCGLNCLKLNAYRRGLISIPDVVWNWGLYCNEGIKTDELINCLYSKETWKYVTAHVPHDGAYGSYEAADNKRVSYLAEQLRYGQKKISEITGINVNDDDMRKAFDEYSVYSQKFDYLSHLVADTDPQPISGNELTLFGAPMGMAFEGFDFLKTALDVLIGEVEERIKNEKGVLPKGSPKLGCYFIPFCLPWVSKAFQDNGINLACSATFMNPKINIQLEEYNDPFMKVAQRWYCDPAAVNLKNQIDITKDTLSEYKLDGMLYGFFSFDRWVGMHKKVMIEILEKATGIQHFYMEGDFWSDLNFKPEERASRIDNICYVLKMNNLFNKK